jgi:hypothetical protein
VALSSWNAASVRDVTVLSLCSYLCAASKANLGAHWLIDR